MQLPRRPVRTHSASTASESARSPDIEDGLEVVPLEHDSIRSAPIVSAYLDEKEVFIGTHEVPEKPLPGIPSSLWACTWGKMSIKYRVLVVLGLQALILLTVGMALLAANSKKPNKDRPEVRIMGGNGTNTSSVAPIERGTFPVPVQIAQQQSSACLARANESRAWQCAFDTMLQLSILPSLGDNEKPIMMTLGLPTNSNRSIHCGQQAPEIGPTELKALNSTENGPQYQFSAKYDRVVILREDQLGQQNISTPPLLGQPKHTFFPPGQPLWRCTFNDTLLEGLMYPNGKDDEVSTASAEMSGASSQLPFKLKLMERRAVSATAPVCEKVVVGSNGGLENSGESVQLQLSGTSSEPGSDPDASCQCQWIVT
ncbi:hypothetical protein E8E13_010304 [Curvularia kusanoi]|uniref:DUF7820 domain-containing protein n=1 Tax=Curvularia kusanoi TaxID=90978 RepID=A0A9P4TNN2_CURKU|nr:hypothetical protein E8E13_010304 [Curvularia kusanoi]